MLEFEARSGLLFTELWLPSKLKGGFQPVELVLDTGSAITVVDTEFTDYLGYSARDGLKRSSLDGAGGRSSGYIIQFPEVRWLDFVVSPLHIACHDMDSRLGVGGLLGMNLLRNFKIHLDFSTGELLSLEHLNQ